MLEESATSESIELWKAPKCCDKLEEGNLEPIDKITHDSSCGTLGSSFDYDTRDPRFEPQHWQFYLQNSSTSCREKTSLRKKCPFL